MLAEMRPNAPTFEPSAATMGAWNNLGADSLDESLLKALIKLKEEQRATKTALEAAQAQVVSLSVENKTLKAAKRLLEAIVKNQANRSASEPQTGLPSAQEQAAAVKEFFTHGSTTSPKQKSILYDVLAKQRQGYETGGYPEDHPGFSKNTQSIIEKQELDISQHNSQDDRLFDLSLVSPLTQHTSDFSAQERNILRHFLDESEPMEDKPSSSPSTSKNTGEVESTPLIDVTPPPQIQFTQKVSELFLDIAAITDITTAQSPMKPVAKPTVAEAVETCHRALRSVINASAEGKMSQAKADIEKPPTLQLPAAFLSKYRPTQKSDTVVDSPVENPFSEDAQTLQEGVQDMGIPSTDPDNGDAATSDTLPTTTHHIVRNRKDLRSWLQEQVKISTESQPAALPVVDTKILWSMSALQPVFDDDQQIKQAMQSNGIFDRHYAATRKTSTHTSYFWQHPVRFLPSPTEKNLYRTVMIDYIPQGATYQDVLAHVRTGALESIQLFPPLRGCTDYFTARIVFTYELGAVLMVMQYQKRFSHRDAFHIKGVPVRVWQVLQPTYPANKQLETDIFQNGYSRILLLEHVEDSGVLPKLHEKLVPELENGAVIKISRTQDGVPMIEFTSVAAAAGAMRRFEQDRDFKGCTFDFDRDYCEDGYGAE